MNEGWSGGVEPAGKESSGDCVCVVLCGVSGGGVALSLLEVALLSGDRRAAA